MIRYAIMSVDTPGYHGTAETFHDARHTAVEFFPLLGAMRVNGVTVTGNTAEVVFHIDSEGVEHRTATGVVWERKDHIAGRDHRG